MCVCMCLCVRASVRLLPSHSDTHILNAILYVVKFAMFKLWMLNQAALRENDGGERSHLSQLHLFHCWLQCLGQLI